MQVQPPARKCLEFFTSQGEHSDDRLTLRPCALSGPRVSQLVGPKMPTTGMPNALAMFITPLSLEMNASHCSMPRTISSMVPPVWSRVPSTYSAGVPKEATL